MEVAHYNHDVDSMIQDIFHHWDINNSGYIEKAELKQCCSDLRLSEEKLAITFNELDLDGDGKISLEDFANSFQKVCSLFDVTQDEVLNQEKSEYKKFEKLLDVIGVKGVLSGQEYVSELFHYMHNSNDSAQLLSLLESFLFSVVRDVKHYSSENAKLEEALKRACEKHAEHMEQLDDELDQQMSRLEMRIKKEEQSKFERSNLDMVWQLETKNKEIQALNAKVSKLENKIKKKEPEEQKLKEEIEEKVQELRYLRSQVTDAQTTVAVIRSELAQLKNDYEDQSSQLEAEKRNVMECVQEQESLTRQLQLLHEANKKLHDTNDDLRSALEMRRGSEGGKSPSPSKRNSISTLYSTVPRAHRRSKSHEPSSRRASNLTGEFSGDDRHPNSASASTPRSSVAAPPPEGSRRSSMLLPTQQSCEVDDPVNEDSLLSELMKVQRSHESPFDTQSTSSDAESVEHDYNHNAGILNAKETGRIHHLIPPARQSCEVESKGSPEDTIDPVVHRYEHAVHSGSHSSGSQSLPGDEVLDWDQVLKRVREIEEAGTCSLGGETDVSEESRVTVEEPALKRVKEAVESGDESIFEVDDDTNEETAQAAVSRPSKRIEDDHVDESGEYPNGEKQAKEPDVDRVPCIVLEEDSESDGGIDEVMSAKSSQRDEGIYPGSTEDQHVVSDSETVDDSNEFDIKSEEPYPANNLATSKETSFLNTTPEECIDKGKGSDEEARLEPVFSPRVNVGTGDSTPRVLLDPDIELFEKGEEPEYYTVFETEPVHERFERMKEIGLKRCPAFVRPGTRPLSERYRKTNFPDGTEEEDEAYSTMPSSERESLRQQLDLLQKTNNDLRTALEVVVGKTRSPSSKGKRRSERGEKCRRNASIKSTHSDYGSISSRSMSPSRSHGAKSGEDIADGAEELSGYDPESDGNNTSTITLQSRHEEAPPIPAKLGATQHERIKIAGRETNDVIWEDEDEAETERPAGSDGFKRADDNSPFKRNSILRKPCRHRSLETLDEGEGPTGRGNRSAWPPIARAGKWHSMEQVKRRNDFAGERTRSLPHLRTQSADRLDFSTGEGLTQLAEKLNALQKSAEDVKAQTPPNKVTDREAPAPPVPQEDLTSAKSYRMEEERRALREIIAPLIRPVPAPRTRKSAHVEPQEDQTQQRHPVIESPRHTSKTLPRGSVVTRIKQSESLPDSDLSRADISELEAQFKSVIKEDEEDIDEDDVDDEELAQLVAMATGLTDSEEETETEDDDTTVGVREAAVGADSISEASTNTALNMSNVDERVPERMFKIVLAGDAAVGKSSFILRLCRNRFHSALNSTLGVDFQMKTLVVDGKTYALQLWDTAGQERFRSIAKSYFRKADGVLLLYDVTCETSFLDVRDWVEAIEESCSKPVPIMLCGNKIDIRQSAAAENKTVITAESGSRLAKEHGALFIETSSKENKNIAEACIELARMLRDVEDIEVKQNNGMKLTDNDIKKKKTNCCST
ncbi:uncharacterized protein LOC5512636 isoform X7 [Nematostella vectensis]|uniref:uncharacterized protein LOC5512636 isoform X7 n=1 Tax=Nematostella vectensis TaxID=45351 RepID=UPI002076FE76|nr:uncharacterized protein LOC5512636 isoform X7 [Nematostella vectensis]